MTNDVAHREPQQLQSLRPKSYGQIVKLAHMACDSGMVPKAYVGKPEMTAIAMMMLAENDLPVITGLKFVAVINGQPAFYGDAVPGIARKRGLIRRRKEWWTGAGESREAHCEVVNSDGDTYKRSFSVGDAKRARLWDRDTYKQYPDTMLMWRARNAAVRDGAPDAFMGPTVEELEALAAAFVGPDNAKEVNPSVAASPLAPQIGPQSRQEEQGQPTRGEPVSSDQQGTLSPSEPTDGWTQEAIDKLPWLAQRTLFLSGIIDDDGQLRADYYGPKLVEPASGDEKVSAVEADLRTVAAAYEATKGRAAESLAELATEAAGAIARRVVSGAEERHHVVHAQVGDTVRVPDLNDGDTVEFKRPEVSPEETGAIASRLRAQAVADASGQEPTKRRGRRSYREIDEETAANLKDRAMAPDVDEMELDLISQSQELKRLGNRAKDLADEVTACVEQSRKALPIFNEEFESSGPVEVREFEDTPSLEAEETQPAASGKPYKLLDPNTGKAFDERSVDEWFDVFDDKLEQLPVGLRTGFIVRHRFILEEMARDHPELRRQWEPLLAETRR